MKPKTKDRKLIKYVKLLSVTNSAKKALSTLSINKVQKVQEMQKDKGSCVFAKIRNKNKILLPPQVQFFIKNLGVRFICLLSDDSLEFIHNEFKIRPPKRLIDFLKEYQEYVYCRKITKTVKIPQKAMEKLDLKTDDFVIILLHDAGFIIKKAPFCNESL